MVTEFIKPITLIPDPLGCAFSFYQGESEGDFLKWGVISCDVCIQAQVCFYFIDEVIGFGSVTVEDLWECSHGFHICGW